jgi:Zn-dependent protease
MSTPVQGGRALLRGRVFGFPVHVDLSFVLIVGLLGWHPGVSARDLAIWLVIAPLSVLAHELGHAVVARTTGARPQIALVGFGGVTTFEPPRPLSRLRSLGISLAGPGVGLLLGAVLVAVNLSVYDTLDPSSWQASALWAGEFTCVGWSLLNLLPVLPLDGGQAMRELLPGAPQVRARRAAMVSVATAGLAALATLYLLPGQPFLAMFMLFFALTNVLALRQSARSGPQRGPAPGPTTPEQAVVALLWRGDATAARQLLAALHEGTPVDLAVHGAVLALTGDRTQGHALMLQELRRRPGDVNAVALLVLTQTLEHDWDAVLATLQGPYGHSAPQTVVDRAVAEARGIGREDVAGRLSVLTPPAAPASPPS